MKDKEKAEIEKLLNEIDELTGEFVRVLQAARQELEKRFDERRFNRYYLTLVEGGEVIPGYKEYLKIKKKIDLKIALINKLLKKND